jgi:hypothetical protein
MEDYLPVLFLVALLIGIGSSLPKAFDQEHGLYKQSVNATK